MRNPGIPAQGPMGVRPSLPVGAAAPRHHGAILLAWGFGTVALGLTVAYLLASGEIRALVLLLLGVLGLLCLKPRRGVFIVMLFLPFMYFLRRQVLHFNEFASRDPILLFPPVVILAMATGVLLFHGPTVVRHIRESTLMKVFMCLLVLFAAQVFNPLQGNLLVGMAGAMYFITPMLWLFVGLLIDEKEVRNLLGVILTIGLVVALYGLYQHQFGFSDVEEYELASKGFFKMLGTQARVMSTFAGIGDFSNYLCTAGFLCFAFYWRTKANLVYPAILAICAFAMLWAGSRSQILVLLFSILIFLVIQAHRKAGLVSRGVIVVILVGSLYGFLYTMTQEEIYHGHGSSNPFVAHVIGGLAHPTQESTFQKRIGTWAYVAGRGLLDQPLGRGLGSTTTAAQKFGPGGRFDADSYFFEIIYGSSIAAGVLFTLLMLSFYRTVLPLFSQAERPFIHKLVTALISAYFLGSVFGANIRDTVNGPLAWLLIGWIIKEAVARARGPHDAAAPARA